ncbi:hypothetical protein GCM10009550_46340 [Actinocorallia libanotica]|uniref:Uncharacterized protein n=1 Tax=Actinocorallia libanotica TaxID=46162 RepID=A0ABP4C155_9ACTN
MLAQRLKDGAGLGVQGACHLLEDRLEGGQGGGDDVGRVERRRVGSGDPPRPDRLDRGGHLGGGHRGVGAEVDAQLVGGGPGDHDPAPARGQRQDAVVAEQDRAAGGDRAPHLGGLRPVRAPAGRGGHAGTGDQSGPRLDLQHPGHRPVDHPLVQTAARDLLHQVGEVPCLGQLGVQPGRERLRRRLARLGGDAVAGPQHVDRLVVADDQAGEAELAAQQPGQQPVVGRRGHPVDVIVGVHDDRQSGLGDRAAERLGVLVDERAPPQLGGGHVQAALGGAEAQEVLAGGQQPRPLLDPADERDGAPRDQFRVLTVGLVHPPPAGVAAEVHDGGEDELDPQVAHVRGGDRRRAPDQVRVPGRGLRPRRGELLPGRVQEPADPLEVHQPADPERRDLPHRLLDPGERVAQAVGVLAEEPRQRQVPDAVRAQLGEPPCVQPRPGPRVEGQQARQAEAAELGDLLVEREPGDQPVDVGHEIPQRMLLMRNRTAPPATVKTPAAR